MAERRAASTPELELEERRGGRRPRTTRSRSAAFQALLQDRRKLRDRRAARSSWHRRRSTSCCPKIVGLDDALERIGDANWYWIVVAIGFNVARVRRLRGALPRRARRPVGGRGPAAPRHARVVPDHHGGLRRHAHLLGGRGGRHRADLLGAAQGRHAAAALGVPDGRLPRAAPTRLPGGAGALRGPAADRRAARRHARWPGRSCRRRSPASSSASSCSSPSSRGDVERRIGGFAGRLPAGPLRAPGWPAARPRWPPACARRSPTCASRARGALAVGGAVGYLGGQHRRPLGELQGLRRRRAVRRGRPGLLRGDGGQPDPVARRAAWAPSTRA